MGGVMDYVTVEDLKSYLRIPAEDETDDAELALAIRAASRAIDKATNRTFGKVQTAEQRLFTAKFDRERGAYVVRLDDFMTTDGLIVESDGQEVTDFTKVPLNAAQKGQPWTGLVFDGTVSTKEGGIAVTAVWGWTAVPTTIKQACLIQASRLFKRRDSPFGVAGSPEMGNELRLLNRLDPDVEVLVNAYRRWWAAA